MLIKIVLFNYSWRWVIVIKKKRLIISDSEIVIVIKIFYLVMYLIFVCSFLLVVCNIYNVMWRNGRNLDIKFFLIFGVVKFVKVEVSFFVI